MTTIYFALMFLVCAQVAAIKGRCTAISKAAQGAAGNGGYVRLAVRS